MRLAALKRHWDRLGRRDPHWAALTHPDKQHTGWDVDAFFQHGRDELAAALARLGTLGVDVDRRRALDFGCGAGRVTQAMGDAFDRADGVDIAASMLDDARRHLRRPDRVVLHLNTADNLARFDDAAFTFVYSTLVLQHMEPRYGRAYLGEFLRVLAPGGALVFQVPSRRVHPSADAGSSRTRIEGRLPAAACRARIAVHEPAIEMQAGDQHTLHVTVENRSPTIWPSLPNTRGDFRINLGNHWIHEDGTVYARDDARCALPHDVAPGTSVDLILYVIAPPHDGQYFVELDLVQENAGWFAERGSETTRVRCEVRGGIDPPPRTLAPAPAVVVRPPFRERHPRAFAVLTTTRARDAYWAWRHGLDAVKRRRDRAIWWLKARLYEPTVPRLVNWWAGLSFGPRMEMHCIPRDEVVRIVENAGGRVLAVDEDMTTGGYVSCRYWVVKP